MNKKLFASSRVHDLSSIGEYKCTITSNPICSKRATGPNGMATVSQIVVWFHDYVYDGLTDRLQPLFPRTDLIDRVITAHSAFCKI